MHQEDMEKLLAWDDGHTRETVRARLEGFGSSGRGLDSQTEISFCFECVQAFDTFGIPPKEAFLELTRTRIPNGRRRPVFTPAQVARKFACRIAGISESTASHKSVRKWASSTRGHTA
jgi:hypothetical protein